MDISTLLSDILLVLWFFLPAAIANAAPVFSAKLPYLDKFSQPLDSGRIWRGKPIFGPNKTWRGLISGMVVATVALWLQQLAVANFDSLSIFTSGINYGTLPVLILGPLFGLGALGADAVESFFKRQRGIESGQSWIPFDQLDYILGAILVSLPFVQLPWLVYVTAVAVWFLMHVIVSYVGWKLGLKSAPI